MAVMTVERNVAAPAEQVWAIVSDLDRSRDVISGIRAAEPCLAGGAFTPGPWGRERCGVVCGRTCRSRSRTNDGEPVRPSGCTM